MTKIKKVILVVIPIVLITLIVLSSSHKSDIYQGNEMKKVKSSNNGTLALMLETSFGSKEYAPATDSAWPGDGYVFNESLSKCDNGGELSWDGSKVIMKSDVNEKCYVYFDVEPPQPKYWNNGFVDTVFVYPNTPTPDLTYANVSELRTGYGIDNFKNNPVYIKTAETEHQVCGYLEENSKEFCLSRNYWVSGDTDGSKTKAKIKKDMENILGVTIADSSCIGDPGSALCIMPNFACYAYSNGNVRCGKVDINCNVVSDGSAGCFGS